MIAKIIPLKNLPSSFFVFDYLVPEDLKKQIKVGQMLKMEFKKTIIFGIVYKIEKTTDAKKLKEISEIVNEKTFLTPSDLEFYLSAAQIYKISPSNLLKMALLPLQKNKLKKIELKEKNKTATEKKEQKSKQYFLYDDEIEHKKLFKNIDSKKTTLIVVPEVRFLKNIIDLLPKNLKEKSVFWYSELSEKEKFQNWLDIRNQEKKVIIGTRASLLLPPSFFDNIIIDFEQDENQKHWDGSPRFLTKDLVEIILNFQNKNITFTSFSPSFEKYYEITKESLKINKKLKSQKLLFTKQNKKPLTIYNLSDRRDWQKSPIFDFKLEEKLIEKIDKKEDIFIYINRKGYATSIQCKNCAFTYKCPDTGLNLIYSKQKNILYSPVSNYEQKFNSVCPKCGSNMVEMYGIGTETVEKYLKNLNISSDYQIIRIDNKQKDIKIKETGPKIYIGTNKALAFLDWKKIKNFIILDIDRELAIPEYTEIEKLWHNLAEINYFRAKDSEISIQTKNPEHVFFKSLNEIDRIYRTELNLRKKLFYPPYSFLVKYFFGLKNGKEAREKCELNYKKIQSILTNKKINVKLNPVFEMQAKFFRAKNWYGFNLRLEKKDWQKNLKFINSYTDSDIKVDPNPINLTTP